MKRRSRLKDKFLVVVLATVICFVVASPFVLDFGQGGQFAVRKGVVEAYIFSFDLRDIAAKSGLTKVPAISEPKSLPIIIGNIIAAGLALIGVVFLIVVIVAGFRWMMAGGNEESIASARKTLIRAATGTVLALMSYAIVQFVIVKLLI